MLKFAARRGFAAAVIVLTVAATQLVGQTAAHASTPTCNDSYYFTLGGSTPIAPVPGYNGNFTCLMRQGTTVPHAVDLLQFTLNINYQYVPGYTSIAVDGIYGPATAGAVRWAQSFWHNHGYPEVTVDGIYGPQTRSHLCWNSDQGYCIYTG